MFFHQWSGTQRLRSFLRWWSNTSIRCRRRGHWSASQSQEPPGTIRYADKALQNLRSRTNPNRRRRPCAIHTAPHLSHQRSTPCRRWISWCSQSSCRWSRSRSGRWGSVSSSLVSSGTVVYTQALVTTLPSPSPSA